MIRKIEYVRSLNHSENSDSTGSIIGIILENLLDFILILEGWERDVEVLDRIKR